MRLTDRQNRMLDGTEGPARQRAMAGLVQLGEAYDAEDMVEIGYAHVHPGTAMYAFDVELVEELAAQGAQMAVPTTGNVVATDLARWRALGAPEKLARLQRRGARANAAMGVAGTFTCAPHLAGFQPTWNMHASAGESAVAVLANSVFGARCNRDGFFVFYAAIAGCYPRFGFHTDVARRPTHRIAVTAELGGETDFSCLGYLLGRLVGDGVPVVELPRRPRMDELDAMSAGFAVTGGSAMFILPGITPPFADAAAALAGAGRLPEAAIAAPDIATIYDAYAPSADESFDLVYLGCPHASLAQLAHYVDLLRGRRIAGSARLWIGTARAVAAQAKASGLLAELTRTGAEVFTDTCPIVCHLACAAAPDPRLALEPSRPAGVVVDSAKQAHYARGMLQCPSLLTDTVGAIESAVSGRFRPPQRAA